MGDTHGSYAPDNLKFNKTNWPTQDKLTKDDVLVQLGDFGYLWNNKQTAEEYAELKHLADKNYTLAFVDGNHENFNRLDNLPTEEKWGNEVGVIKVGKWGNIYHLKRGNIYTINDKTFLVIGGARSTDKLQRTAGISWWAREELSYNEQQHTLTSLKKVDHKVDFVLTHTMPSQIVQAYAHRETNLWIKNSILYEKEKCPVAEFLQHVADITEFKEWFSGHLHTDMTIEDGAGRAYNIMYNEAPLEVT